MVDYKGGIDVGVWYPISYKKTVTFFISLSLMVVYFP